MAEPPAPPPSGPRSDTLPSSFDSNPEFFEEKRFAKLVRRLREEPLIPLGCAATVYALYQASKSIRAGDHHQTNRMFRARIYAQGFTLVALVGGSIFWKDDRMKRKELEKVLDEKKKAEKREKWLKELEQRDREDREWRGRFEDVAVRAREAEEGAMLALRGKGGKKGEEGGEVVGEAKTRMRRGNEKVEAKEETVADATKEVAQQAKDSMKTARMRAVESSHKVDKEAEAIAEQVKEGAKQGKENMKQAIEKAFQNKSVLEQVQSSGWGRGMWSVREAWRRR